MQLPATHTLDLCHVWHDETPRSGALNMAIDQILLESHSDVPLLRFYHWDRPTVSLGYFESLTDAQVSFPGGDIDYIRRWTGGGIVDHRADVTYTLILPRSHPWSQMRAVESYRIIHQAVASALISTDIACQLNSETNHHSSTTCFTNPVRHDIITANGKKLAGAGQKRNRQGLLHQGSVVGIQDPARWKTIFTEVLTPTTHPFRPEVSFYEAARKLSNSRYATTAWNSKRP